MIVYYATTHYHVLCAILHKLIYKKENEALLLISNTRAGHDSLCEKVKKQNIFKNVILYEDKSIVRRASREYNLFRHDLNMHRIMNWVLKKVEEITPFPITSNNEFYLWSDFRPLALYLIKHNIKYYYFEDACGVLSRPELLMSVLKSKWTNKVISHFNLNGQNELVINRFADYSAQIEEFEDNKLVDFSVKKLLQSLNDLDKQKIINIFSGITIEKSRTKKAIVLTQPFIQRNKISFEEQRLMYGLLIDYYFKNMDIYIKPHPLDFMANYKGWFSDCYVLDGKMPSEILNICLNTNFEAGISVSSTAVNSLVDYINNIILFDSKSENEIKNLHKYCLICEILHKLDYKKYNIITDGISNCVLKETAKNYKKIDIKKISFSDELPSNIQNKKNNSICIIKNGEKYDIIDLIEHFNLVIIINYKNNLKKDLDFLKNYGEICRIFEICITGEQNTEKEEIFVCSKNKILLKKISEIDYKNQLKHSKLKTKINNYKLMDDEMKDKIIEILLLQNEQLRRNK